MTDISTMHALTLVNQQCVDPPGLYWRSSTPSTKALDLGRLPPDFEREALLLKNTCSDRSMRANLHALFTNRQTE